MSRFAWMVLGVALAGCAGAGAQSAEHTPFRGENPCPGRGERFHLGEPSVWSGFPANATIVRQARHRGNPGVCYTTPESLADAG